MFASKTSHKRRRSSARGDKSRDGASTSRAIITVAGSIKGKQREQQDVQSWAWKRLQRVVASHAINHCLQILLPISSPEEASEAIAKLPSSSKSYLARVPLCLFLDPIFITSHIKRGSMVALSRGKLDTDDVVCLDGKGILYLSLTRDSYQNFGIVGQALKQSRTSSGKGRDRFSGKVERWMVKIDILAASFVPGRPGYDRTLARLREWDQRKSTNKDADDLSSWDMLFCWTSSNDSHFGEFIHFPSRHVPQSSIKEVDSRPTVSKVDDCWIPIQTTHWAKGWKSEERQRGQLDWESWNDELESFLEWTALASLSADCVRTYSRNDHLNSYEVGAGQGRRPGSVLKIVYRGLLPSGFCHLIMQTIQTHLKCKKAIPRSSFAWLSCSGFSESPLAWRMEPMSMNPPNPSDGAVQQIESSSSSDENEEESDDLFSDMDQRPETGRKAQRRRQKKRAKRGTITREQVGQQVKAPGASNCNGWQVLFFADEGDGGDDDDKEQAEYVSVENIGGCLKC